jgi:hypothetical protein
MSTWIKFKDGTIAHIVDICVCGKILHKYVENGHIYEREGTAIRRAFALYRKLMYNSMRLRRKRKRIARERRMNFSSELIKPTIDTFYEDGELVHKVQETGKKYKSINMAIKNALNYAKGRS